MFPKKGSRKIVVGGVTFYYRIGKAYISVWGPRGSSYAYKHIAFSEFCSLKDLENGNAYITPAMVAEYIKDYYDTIC